MKQIAVGTSEIGQLAVLVGARGKQSKAPAKGRRAADGTWLQNCPKRSIRGTVRKLE